MDEMTLEQKMTLKAILEGDYKIKVIGFSEYFSNDDVAIRVDEQKMAFIKPDGKIIRRQDTEVEL